MTNPRRDTLPKGDIVVDENVFIAAKCKIALLGIPEVCPNVIRHVAGLNVDYFFHGLVLTDASFSQPIQRYDKEVPQISSGALNGEEQESRSSLRVPEESPLQDGNINRRWTRSALIRQFGNCCPTHVT